MDRACDKTVPCSDAIDGMEKAFCVSRGWGEIDGGTTSHPFGIFGLIRLVQKQRTVESLLGEKPSPLLC